MREIRGPIWTITGLAALICLALSLVQFMGTWRPAQAQASGCPNWVTNGDFETNQGWVAGAGGIAPQYVTTQYHSPQRSVLMGIPPGNPAQVGNSSIRQQFAVTIPNNANRVTLSFWYLTFQPTTPTGDFIEMNLLGPDGRPLLIPSWRSFYPNQPAWTQALLDLSSWRGLTVQLYFNVYNDGGAPAALYLDDVALQICTGGTVVPTPPNYTVSPVPSFMPATITPSGNPTATPTSPTPILTLTPGTLPSPPPTITPPPTGNCLELVRDGRFTQGFAEWEVAPNRIMPQPIVVPGGTYAQLGAWQTNLDSYSSIGQWISLPPGYGQITLYFYTWTWTQGAAGADRQEAAFLATDSQVLQKFWRPTGSNDRQWMPHTFPVTSYAGQDVTLYFNAYNDGLNNPSGMYLGEVHIWACAPVQAAPLQAPVQPLEAQPQQVPPQAQALMPGTAMPAPGAGPVPAQANAGLPTTDQAGTVIPPPGPAAAAAAPRQTGSVPVPTEIGQVGSAQGPAETTRQPAVAQTVTVAPLDTVLVARGTPPPPARPVGLGATPQATSTPSPQSFWNRLNNALHLPPGWPLGLAAIIVILVLLIWALSQR
jgi:hypothetical protein